MTALMPGSSEVRIAKALAHPLRARILERLGERVASPGEIAVEMDAPLGVVSYHVRMLRDYDCVELVRTEPRRGALQHFYKATARGDLGDQWAALPVTLRRELVGAEIADLVADVAAAGEAGKLDAAGVYVRRSLIELDEKGRAKANRLLASTLERLTTIASESAARGGEMTPTEVGLLHFERPSNLDAPNAAR